jgi:hypothetical protein
MPSSFFFLPLGLSPSRYRDFKVCRAERFRRTNPTVNFANREGFEGSCALLFRRHDAINAARAEENRSATASTKNSSPVAALRGDKLPQWIPRHTLLRGNP